MPLLSGWTLQQHFPSCAFSQRLVLLIAALCGGWLCSPCGCSLVGKTLSWESTSLYFRHPCLGGASQNHKQCTAIFRCWTAILAITENDKFNVFTMGPLWNFVSHFSAQTWENHLPKSCYYLSPLESNQAQSFPPWSREGHKWHSCSFASCQYVGLILLLSDINYQRIRNTDSCAPTTTD